MYTFLLFEFIKLSKFELERALPQTTDQSKVVTLVSRLWYRVSNDFVACLEHDHSNSTCPQHRRFGFDVPTSIKEDVIINLCLFRKNLTLFIRYQAYTR